MNKKLEAKITLDELEEAVKLLASDKAPRHMTHMTINLGLVLMMRRALLPPMRPPTHAGPLPSPFQPAPPNPSPSSPSQCQRLLALKTEWIVEFFKDYWELIGPNYLKIIVIA
jgi:hypothetical protein